IGEQLAHLDDELVDNQLETPPALACDSCRHRARYEHTLRGRLQPQLKVERSTLRHPDKIVAQPRKRGNTTPIGKHRPCAAQSPDIQDERIARVEVWSRCGVLGHAKLAVIGTKPPASLADDSS